MSSDDDRNASLYTVPNVDIHAAGPVERRGARRFVVLRQYPGGFAEEGSLEKEIANLGVVAGSGLLPKD